MALLPGEEPFSEADKDPTLVARNRERRSRYGKPEVAFDPAPQFDAPDEVQAAWALRQHRGELERRGRTEKQAYAAGKQGVPYQGDDPALKEVHEVGEEMHRADRRHDFLIGIGALSRHIPMGHSLGGPGKLLTAGRSAWRY